MSRDEAYSTLTKRISNLMLLIDIEKAKMKIETDPKEFKVMKVRLENLMELLDTNNRAFAMIFNRNFDMKLDLDTEMQ